MEFQNHVIKLYTLKVFNKECSIEMIRSMREPLKNVILIDLFETLLKGCMNLNSYSNFCDVEEFKNFPFEKIIELISSISHEINFI